MPPVGNIFWLFGRSAVGKTTLARRLHQGMRERHIPVFYLDGDEIRSGLNSDLGFSSAARLENHRRSAEIARLAAAQQFNVLISTIAPEYDHRDIVQNILGEKLVWFYIHAPLEVCIQRDPKGLYKKAKAGQVKEFLNYPFDTPRPQEAYNYVDTDAHNVEDCYQSMLKVVTRRLAEADQRL